MRGGRAADDRNRSRCGPAPATTASVTSGRARSSLGGSAAHSWSRAASVIWPSPLPAIRSRPARDLALQSLDHARASTGGCPSRSRRWCWPRSAPSTPCRAGSTRRRRWLDRAEHALRPDAEPAKAILVRYAGALQRLGQGRPGEALASFAEAQRLQSQLPRPDPLAICGPRAPGTDARGPGRRRWLLGPCSRPRPTAEREFAETRIALAAIHLAERDPRGALDAARCPSSPAKPPVIADYSLPNAFIVDCRRSRPDRRLEGGRGRRGAGARPGGARRARPAVSPHAGA